MVMDCPLCLKKVLDDGYICSRWILGSLLDVKGNRFPRACPGKSILS